MSRISYKGFKSILNYKALEEKIPILGICYGSEEGTLSGLGCIPAKTIKFPKSKELKVPHMGWNSVRKSNRSYLTEGLPDDSWYYFVHSYYVKAENEKNSIGGLNNLVQQDTKIHLSLHHANTKTTHSLRA